MMAPTTGGEFAMCEALEKRVCVVNWWFRGSKVGNGWERGRKRVPCRTNV